MYVIRKPVIRLSQSFYTRPQTRIALHAGNVLLVLIDRFHVTSHHFRSAILVYHFRLRNPRNFSTTIIPTSKMDSKEKEKESQNKSGVDYSFPISEYAKQLDFPVRDRYLQKIAAIGIDPVLVEGKDFKPDCLPPVESTDILCYLVLETSFYTQKQFKAFRSLEAYNKTLLKETCQRKSLFPQNRKWLPFMLNLVSLVASPSL